MAKLRLTLYALCLCCSCYVAAQSLIGSEITLPVPESALRLPATPALLPQYALPDSLLSAPTLYSTDGLRLQLPDFTDYASFSFQQDYSRAGLLHAFDDGALFGTGSRTTYIGLGVAATASVHYMYSPIDNLQITVGASAAKYAFDNRYANQFGLSGSLYYAFSEQLSMTLYGSYYFRQPFFSVAAYPYVNYSEFGGYMSLQNDYVGMSLGARHYYNPMVGRWETAPIVKPYIRVNKKVSIGVDVGGLLRNVIIDARAPKPLQKR